MERITDLLRGCVTLEVTGTFPADILNRFARNGIVFWDVVPRDPYTMTMTIRMRDLKRAGELAARGQCSLKTGRGRGAPVALRRLRRRVALVLGLCLCLLFLFWSSLYIWEMEVTGNDTLTDEEILTALADIGVGVGSFWPSFSSDNIRSQVLVRVPALGWITVNVHGSRAEVIVRERILKPEIIPEDEPTNVVAEKSGILAEVRVLRGEALVKAGQTVLAGDTLVSGFVTSSFAPVRTEHAMAEIRARTWYELSACAPLTEERKVPEGREKSRFAIIIFGRRINFYVGSGILWPNCDKIMEEKKLALKDVFTLPVEFVKETLRPYQVVTVERDADALLTELQNSLSERLAKEIGENGSVVTTAFSSAKSGGLLIVTLRSECVERIDGLRALDLTQLPETQVEN